MTGEEFKALRAGKKVIKKPSKPTVSARDFIMNRSKELIKVTIEGPDGTMDIMIRARLTKGEIKNHKKFLGMFKDPESVSDIDADKITAKFLASITEDPLLNEKFWSSDDVDSYIAQELLVAFMSKASSVLEGVKKFR